MSSDQPSNSLQTKSTIDEEMSEALTTRSKHKGLQLYNTLKKRVPEMYWNDHGVVKINNQTLQGSNIIDIITFMMSDSKKSYPEGLKTIASYIKKRNIPLLLIRNSKMLGLIRGLSASTPPNSPQPHNSEEEEEEEENETFSDVKEEFSNDTTTTKIGKWLLF